MRAEVDEVDEAIRRQMTDGDDSNGDSDDNDCENDNDCDNDNNRDDDERDASKSAQGLISSSLLVPPSESGLSFGQGKKIYSVSILRSQQPAVTLGSLDSRGAEDPTFRNFHARLATWINRTFPVYGCPFGPGLSRVALQADDQASFAFGPVCKLIAFQGDGI